MKVVNANLNIEIIRFVLLLTQLGLSASLMGCQMATNRTELLSDQVAETSLDQPKVEEKYKLSADRKLVEELRKDIPEEQKAENDEVALFAGWMSEVRWTPAEVRSKFDSLYRKKREVFEKDIKKSREEFNKNQATSKKDFLKNMDEQSAEIKNKKMDSKERKSRLDEISVSRKEFYTDQKGKRDEFEFGIREKRKEFEDYLRSKRNEFDQEWRSYNKRYQEQKAAENAHKRDTNKK